MTNAVKKTEASRAVREKGAGVFPIPPPLYYGAAFAGGMFLHGAMTPQVPGRPTTALAGTWWPLLFLPFTLFAVNQLAVKPEESHLGGRYASVYADHRPRVRRWL